MAVRIFRKPFVCKKGVDSPFSMRMSNSDGTPTDITGYQFRTDLRYTPNGEVIATLTNGNGFEVDGPNGTVTMTLSSATSLLVDTSKSKVDFPFANVYFDIEYNDGVNTSKWKAWAMGMFRVMEQFTRSNDV